MSTTAASGESRRWSDVLGHLRVARVSADAELDLPGLPARLASLAAELRVLVRQFPFHALTPVALGDAIEQAQVVREMAHTVTAVPAGEVDRRGIATDVGLSRNDWVSAYAPNLAGGQSAAVTAVAAALAEPRWAVLAGKLRAGVVSVEAAAVVIRLHNELARVADPVQLEQVVDSLVEQVEVFSVKELRQLAAQARATLRPPADVEGEAARLRAGRSLTKVGRSAGMIEYRLRLDPEGAAVLDAALDPLSLSRPRPDLDWDHYRPDSGTPRSSCGESAGAGGPEGGDNGEGGGSGEGGCEPQGRRDPRVAATRRADALLELVARAVSAPEGVPRTPRTKLVVTMSQQALLEQLATGSGSGVADNGEVLTAGTVRRLACEAQIIPAALGAPSQPLDLGYVERYFTPAQRRALAIRDKGCTYPGCTIPPQWCEGHHIQHWAKGGRTDLVNGALLCGRHHTVVHQLGLTATVTLEHGVIWRRPAAHER